MNCIRILLLFLIISCVSTLNAQSVKDFNIYNFTNDNGLPQNSVKAITLDKDGYLWIATESGLVRYDGRNFRIYNRNNVHILYSNRISNVGLMRDRRMYFIDDNTNIYVKSAKGRFVKLDKKANSDLLVNRKGDFYNPSAHLGIAGYNYLGAQFIGNWTNNTIFLQTTDSNSGFVSINKNIIAYVAHRRVDWIDSIPYYNKHLQNASGILHNRFYFFDLDFKINSLDSRGRINPVKLQGLKPLTRNRKPLPPNYSLLQQQDSLYLLYDNKIYRLSYADQHTLTATLLVEAQGIPNITCFQEYRSLNICVIGSSTKGLFLLQKKEFKTLSFPETDNIFAAQAAYGDSGVLTSFGILTTNTTTKLPFDRIKKQAILRDRQGNYWFNKAAEAIIKVSPDLRIIQEIRQKDLYITCFAETPDGSIWFITNKNKLGKIGAKGIEWLSFTLSPNSMFCLLPVDNDRFWIGGNRHLLLIDTRTRKTISYNYFKDHDVRYLRLDNRQILWIGTYGKGYFALKGTSLIKLPLDNKGSLNFVHALLEDKKGNMWITTNNGLLRCRKADLEAYILGKVTNVYYQFYNKEQGFNTNEFNGGCSPPALQLGDGRISFPSMDGLVQFYPDSLNEAYPTSRIFIDELLIDGRIYAISHGVTLPPSFNRFELQISSPYFGNPANQLIEYQLKNFDDRWYPVNSNNSIVYNRLPYGVYRLLLRKKAGFATGGYITSDIQFTVAPFFYQEWYFKLSGILLAVLLILLFFRLRYFFLIKKQHMLEHKVQQRTRELVYNNRLKEKLTLLIAHDLQSPLHFLTILARHVHKAAQSKDIGSVLEGSEEIKNTTAKIYSFVKEFSLWNMSLNENYRLNKTNFPVSPLIDELKQFFEEMLRLKNNILTVEIEQEVTIKSDRDVLKAILRNVIDNANKYTQNGRITVNVDKDAHNDLVLMIKDTGNGMSEQQLEKIHYRIRQSPSIPAIEKDGRLGFQLIIDFASRLDAKLDISSTNGKGTTITISGITCED